MKTNQNMIRKMGEFDVIQRTSDGYFNATHLFNQWNAKYPNEQRRLDHFWTITGIEDLMKEIVKNEPNISSLKIGDDVNKLTFNELKSIVSKTSKSNKGESAGTSMHPVLYVKCAMYLSPRFEYHVLKFVSDEMIKYRNEAGDEYRNLSSAIRKIVSADFMPIAMSKIGEAVNWIIFNKHESGIRNQFGEESKQRELSLFEKKLSELVNEEFLTNYEQVLNYLKRKYKEKYYPKIFAS